MGRTQTAGARERKAAFDLLEALGSSLDIRLMLQRAYPSLLRLVPADHAALGLCTTGRPEDFAWLVAEMPPAFFATYPEMAPHDFVRASVITRPNIVLRDQDMVRRRDLETNMMYHRAREVGAPLEQVMAVMLNVHADDGWQSGLALYRERRRPFSAREQAALQSVTTAIANAVRSCHLFGAAADRAAALAALLETRGAALLLAAPPATEVERSEGATRLIERWFAAHERRPGQLPAPLAALLERVHPVPHAMAALAPWTRAGAGATLEVSFLPLPDGGRGRARWALLLRELPHAVVMPGSWRDRLTARELEVSAAVARGWDNRVIARELGCAEATVKRHLQNIFDKLGLPSRTALVARAAEIQRS